MCLLHGYYIRLKLSVQHQKAGSHFDLVARTRCCFHFQLPLWPLTASRLLQVRPVSPRLSRGWRFSSDLPWPWTPLSGSRRSTAGELRLGLFMSLWRLSDPLSGKNSGRPSPSRERIHFYREREKDGGQSAASRCTKLIGRDRLRLMAAITVKGGSAKVIWRGWIKTRRHYAVIALFNTSLMASLSLILGPPFFSYFLFIGFLTERRRTCIWWFLFFNWLYLPSWFGCTSPQVLRVGTHWCSS